MHRLFIVFISFVFCLLILEKYILHTYLLTNLFICSITNLLVYLEICATRTANLYFDQDE